MLKFLQVVVVGRFRISMEVIIVWGSNWIIFKITNKHKSWVSLAGSPRSCREDSQGPAQHLAAPVVWALLHEETSGGDTGETEKQNDSCGMERPRKEEMKTERSG